MLILSATGHQHDIFCGETGAKRELFSRPRDFAQRHLSSAITSRRPPWRTPTSPLRTRRLMFVACLITCEPDLESSLRVLVRFPFSLLFCGFRGGNNYFAPTPPFYPFVIAQEPASIRVRAAPRRLS